MHCKTCRARESVLQGGFCNLTSKPLTFSTRMYFGGFFMFGSMFIK